MMAARDDAGGGTGNARRLRERQAGICSIEFKLEQLTDAVVVDLAVTKSQMSIGACSMTASCFRWGTVCNNRKIGLTRSRTIRAIMVGHHIDLVAGDSNGTAWRCSNRDNISTIDEPFADCALPTPPGPTPLWGPGSIPNNWADVCGFLKPPDSDRYWKVRMHGAFSILRKILGCVQPIQSCNHETWLHLDFVNWRNSQSHHEEPDRRILLKGRPTPYQYGQQKRRISGIMSDHSLSS